LSLLFAKTLLVKIFFNARCVGGFKQLLLIERVDMKNMKSWVAILISVTLAGCGTVGGGTRASGSIYQPTEASSIQILFERPVRPHEIIGQVRGQGGFLASDEAVYRSMQKEAAELGAHAILVPVGVDLIDGYGSKRANALAIRYKDGRSSGETYAVTPTSTKPTTPEANQIVPRNASDTAEGLPYGGIASGSDHELIYFTSPYDKEKRVLQISKKYSGTKNKCPFTGNLFIIP
jgi:hypothetical protein